MLPGFVVIRVCVWARACACVFLARGRGNGGGGLRAFRVERFGA